MLRQYLNCNEILEIFLTSFCNILCYVGIFLWETHNMKNVTKNKMHIVGNEILNEIVTKFQKN